jgi:uncharacterized membrane protein YdjX (TVP38/TMEM64 family)
VSVMTGWFAQRKPGLSAKAVIAVTALVLLLMAAMPLAFLAAVIMMVLGHVIGGLAVLGGSVLAAVLAVGLAGVTGMQYMRRLVSRASFNIVQLDRTRYGDVADHSDMAEPNGSGYHDVVQLDRSEYTDVR